MAKLLAVVFADSHLTEKSCKGAHGDAYFSFTQIVDFAIQRGAEMVIGAGDLIDAQLNRAAPVAFLYRQLNRLRDESIGFLYVQGQHEFDEPPWLSGHGWAKHIHNQTMQLGAYRLYGLDFMPGRQFQAALAAIPAGSDVLVTHAMWHEFAGDLIQPQGSIAELPHVRFVFTGDLHKTFIKQLVGKDGQQVTVASSGSSHMRAINEPPTKYFLTFYDDGSIKKVKLLTRPVMTWGAFASPEDIDYFVGRFEDVLQSCLAQSPELPEALCQPLLELRYSARLKDFVRRVRNRVNGRAILYFKELPAEERQAARQAALQAVAQGGGLTPLALLPELVDRTKKPELFELLTRLLETGERQGDTAAELERFIQDYLAAKEPAHALRAE